MQVPTAPLLQEHHERPRNRGPLEQANTRGLVHDEASGDALRLQLRIEGGRIVRAGFTAFGHPLLSACASFVSECVTGQEIEHAAGIRVEEVARALCVHPQHARRVQMVMTALLQAITAYARRRGLVFEGVTS